MSVRQLDALTSLRFVAAFYVFIFHCAFVFYGVDHSSPLYLGPSGVTFFFVLSGFILAHNYAGRDFQNARVFWNYIRARIARIYPVYILSLFISAPFTYSKFLTMEPTPYKYLYASSAVLAPIALQSWVPGAACALNCPGWSISVEWFFYLLLPLTLVYAVRRPILWFWLALAALVVLFATLDEVWNQLGWAGTIMVPKEMPAAQILGQFVKYFPPWRVPEFLLGVALYALWSRDQRENLTGVMFVAALLAALAVYLMMDHLPDVGLHNGLSTVVWVPLIAAAANVKSGLLTHPVFVFLGRISFSLYLLHMPILLAAKRIDARTDLVDANLALLIAAPVSFAIAIAVFLYVEEPSRRLIMARARTA